MCEVKLEAVEDVQVDEAQVSDIFLISSGFQVSNPFGKEALAGQELAGFLRATLARKSDVSDHHHSPMTIWQEV